MQYYSNSPVVLLQQGKWRMHSQHSCHFLSPFTHHYLPIGLKVGGPFGLFILPPLAEMPFWPLENFGNLLEGSTNCCLSKPDTGSVRTFFCYAFNYPYCFLPKRTDWTKHTQPIEPNCIQKPPEVTPEAPSCFLPMCWRCIKLSKGISFPLESDSRKKSGGEKMANTSALSVTWRFGETVQFYD